MLKPIALLRYAPVALASVIVQVAGCDTKPAPSIPAEEPKPPTVTVTPPVMDRLGLLGAIDRAASAYASGQGFEHEGLAGRRFIIRQAMGCQAPLKAGSTAPQGVGVLMQIENSSDLKLVLSPADWTASLDSPAGSGSWEAAEGFWLAWPWLRTDGCPRPLLAESEADEIVDDSLTSAKKVTGDPSLDKAVTTRPHTAGLAAVFEVDGSRVKRRMGRAYEYTLRGDGKVSPDKDQGGYRLVMEGRIAAFSDGRSIRCGAAGVDQRPVCVAAIHLERVAFETSGGQQLSEWRGG